MKYRSLQDFFEDYPKIALAFSGGVDSAYLLHAAVICGAEVKAYFVKSQFQPDFELDDAKRLAGELRADMEILDCDVLVDCTISENPENRCYYCKHKIFEKLLAAAKADGFDTIIDGTNASDDAGDRPGMKALQEMKVLSPLRLCGITKEAVRQLSREAGLFTWNKPAYACLATRIPTGETITAEKLSRVEGAEAVLTDLGFRDFRVRYFHDAARIQVPESQLELAVKKRREIQERLKPYFAVALVDLEVR